MQARYYKRGFTLVELSLSVAVIGVLTIAIALIISNTIQSYRRGLTLNAVNTVGMDLVDDLRTAVKNASSKSLLELCERYYEGGGSNSALSKCKDDTGYGFVAYVGESANITLEDGTTTVNNVPLYGAFCTGSYSYIWNSGYFFNNAITTQPANASWKDGYARLTDVDPSGNPKPYRSDPAKLLKVKDPRRGICTSKVRPKNVFSGGDLVYSADYSYNNSYNSNQYRALFTTFGYSGLESRDIEELLTSNNENNAGDLAIYDLNVAKPVAENSTQDNLFYSVSFILGSIGGGINIKSNGKSCATPNDYNLENFDYCAINRFSFATQAIGE